MTDRPEATDVSAGSREQLYQCMARRADASFELTDALLCTDGPVKTLVGLPPAPEHRSTGAPEHRWGQGAMWDALKFGRIDVESLRRQPVTSPLPRTADGRLVLAVDVPP